MLPIIIETLVRKKAPDDSKIDRRLGLAEGAQERVFAVIAHVANVPILQSRFYTDAAGDIHDRERDFTIRARLEKAKAAFAQAQAVAIPSRF